MVTSLRLFTLNELTSRRFRSKGLLAPPLFDACVDSAPRLAHFSPSLPRHPSCPGFPSPESRRRTLGHGVRRRYSFSSLISSDIFIPSLRLPFLPLVTHIPLPLFLSLFYFSFFIFSIIAFPPPLLPACIRPPSQPLHRKVAYTPRIYSSVVVEAEGEGAVIASFRRLRTFRHARRSYSVERVFLDRFFRPLSSSQLPPL